MKYINIIIFGFENHVSSMKGHDIQLQRNVMLIINRIKENWRNVVEISKKLTKPGFFHKVENHERVVLNTY